MHQASKKGNFRHIFDFEKINFKLGDYFYSLLLSILKCQTLYSYIKHISSLESNLHLNFFWLKTTKMCMSNIASKTQYHEYIIKYVPKVSFLLDAFIELEVYMCTNHV